MDIYFKKEINILEEPYIGSEVIKIIKAGDKIEYNRTIKIDNLKWIVTSDGYILYEQNYLQEKGQYIIEAYLEKNKVLELKDSSLKINLSNEQYFNFRPINKEDYLIMFENYILGVGQTKEGNLSIKKYNQNDNLDDAKKWNLIRIKENLFKIKNKFFNYFIDIPQGNTDIGTKVLLSTQNDSISQYFYLWKKSNLYELSISLPFETITERIIESKNMLRYLEIDNYIENNEYDFSTCQYLEKINCCCKHLQYFKDLNIKNIILREEEETHLNKEDFMYFTELLSITLPLSLTSIEEDTFKNMKFLKEINGNLKWYKYFNIEEFTVPMGEKKLKREIFYKWKSLLKLHLQDTIEEIEKGCFEESGIEEIKIPKKIKIIPDDAFKNCFNLKHIIIPENVEFISVTAFANCPKLSIENIICPNRFKYIFRKKITIKKNILFKNDECFQFIGLEEIDIPLTTKFSSEEDEQFFFGRLPNLIKVNINPKYFKNINTSKLITIKIPEGINKLTSNMFENCFSLEYLELPESIKIIDDLNISEIFYNINTFINCINLKSVKLPEDIIEISNFLFYKCYKLKTVISLDGVVERFNLIYSVNEGDKILYLKDLQKITNLHTLIIPSSIENIILDNHELSECLECVECDPKWLQYLPIYQLKKIIVPEFVDIVNETDFQSGNNIQFVIFKGNPILMGNKCNDFENISFFKCNPSLALNCSNEFKKSKKTISINNKCQELVDQNFKNWSGLKQINLPNNLKIIGKEAFAYCNNLFSIEIPDSVVEIKENCFIGCDNLNEIICNGKFLRFFPFDKVKLLKIKNTTKEIDENILNKYTNLEVLELPSHITKLNINLYKLNKLKCSGELLEKLSGNIKKNINSIELHPGYITKRMLKDCKNLQNYFINEKVSFERQEIKDIHTTTIEDIINSDSSNRIYEYYLRKMVNDIRDNVISDYNQNDELDKITYILTFICEKIKNDSKMKEKKLNFTPHPVQCFAMIRLLNEILNSNANSKGALAEIQTGEGKSYIVSVVAIALVFQYKKTVDIVTPNLELAFRDEENQREYYSLFNIKSGVLASEHGDKEFINLYNSDFKGKKSESRSGFYIHVLDYPIIYSTNFNYQFLHLYSLFQKGIIRKRKFDVVLIDEVDNMLLDQMTKPAIIGQRAKFYNFNNILNTIYEFRDMNEEYILNKLKKYSKVSNINLDIVQKCKRSARIAKFNELNVDYILEKNEQKGKTKLIIIDKVTGYKQPGTRWFQYIHEFCEIKENLKIKFPILSYCSINQNIYFNLYEKISGVTGTLGDLNDQLILKNNYKINTFKVPRNKIRPKKILQKIRPDSDFILYEQIFNEISLEVSKGRPVLVIMDNLSHVYTFNQLYFDNQCRIISGVEFGEDKKTIKLAGNEGQITLATSAGGRGVDIKLTQKSIDSGGLHVIIPFLLANERCEIQAFGRSGRQGQPGSCTIYRNLNRDGYIKTSEFDPKEKSKYEIQSDFDAFIGKSWPWIYKGNPYLLNNIKYEFNSTVEKILEELISEIKIGLINYAYKDKSYFINAIYTSIIMSWSFFYNYLDWNIKTVNINEEYKKYKDKLIKWIPPNISLEKCFNHFVEKCHIEEIVYNIEHPKLKILPNVEINAIDFLRNQAYLITKGLFNVEINFIEIDHEYLISVFPKITCKISQSVSIQVENQTDTYPIKNNISIGSKSLTPKFSQDFFDVFHIDISSAIFSIKLKLKELVKNGVISIGLGFNKIQLSISVSENVDLEKFAGSILYTIYFNRNPYKVPALVPLPIPYPAFSFARSRLPYIPKKGPIKSPFPAPNPKPRVLYPDLGNVAVDLGKGLLLAGVIVLAVVAAVEIVSVAGAPAGAGTAAMCVALTSQVLA